MSHHAPGSKEGLALTGLLAGLTDTLMDLSAVLWSNSAVILADFLKTFIEFLAILLSWLTVRQLQRGRHHRFEYGLEKLEQFSSLLIGLLMSLGLVAILGNAIPRLFHPETVGGGGVWVGLANQIIFGLVNCYLAVRSYRQARDNHSALLASQARLFGSRFLGNVIILASLALSLTMADRPWAKYLDPAGSLLIAGFMLTAILGILSMSVFDLLDRSLEESDQMIILSELASHFDGYHNFHGVRSRRAGSKAFVDIFLEFGPEQSGAEIHRLADSLRSRIEARLKGAQVVVALSQPPRT